MAAADVEKARTVLERLERIEALERSGAPAPVLLGELRELLHEAEAWTLEEGGEAGEAAVDRLRTALAREQPPLLPTASVTLEPIST
jgi:hypothetical protein